jgi:nucleoside-diphosphate-sugar epimerase
MARNLITGGLGLMGRYIARQLLEDGEDVILFDMHDEFPPGDGDLKEKAEIITGDIGNWVQVVEAVERSKADRIYHNAALLLAILEKYPATGFKINLEGTFNVLEAARLCAVKQLLFPGSRSTFGPASPDIVFDDTRQRPVNMYAITKLTGELLGEYYGRRYGFDFRALRFPVVIGVGRKVTPPISDINSIIEESYAGRPFTSRLDPETPINLIYIKEVVRAFEMYKKVDESKLSRKTYNIKGINLIPVELVDLLKQHLPQVKIDFNPDKGDDALRLRAAMTKQMDESLAQKEWGWQPNYFLNEMVKDFIDELKFVEKMKNDRKISKQKRGAAL